MSARPKFLPLVMYAMFAPSAAAQETTLSISTEVFPDEVAARVTQVGIEMIAASESLPSDVARAIVANKLWALDRPITVAFHGGTAAIHRKIESEARRWERPDNRIRFDFGRDPVSGEYRRWARTDAAYAADVRIAFGDRFVGYWSAVGTDALHAKAFPPNQESMNFANFLVALPSDWAIVVQHEFAHALGFEHDHRRKECVDELRWETDAGRRGVYDYYLHHHGWARDTVDRALRPDPFLEPKFVFAHDQASCTHYTLPIEIFRNPDPSANRCYTKPVSACSAGDYAAAAQAYPAGPSSGDIATMNIRALENDARLLDASSAARDIVRSKQDVLRAQVREPRR